MCLSESIRYSCSLSHPRHAAGGVDSGSDDNDDVDVDDASSSGYSWWQCCY